MVFWVVARVFLWVVGGSVVFLSFLFLIGSVVARVFAIVLLGYYVNDIIDGCNLVSQESVK